uniref:Uncharacterized protein n=1 Tax=Knipowitschia caucasica TaxID=637954 RepID=A0AAV2MG96_KNICA
MGSRTDGVVRGQMAGLQRDQRVIGNLVSVIRHKNRQEVGMLAALTRRKWGSLITGQRTEEAEDTEDEEKEEETEEMEEMEEMEEKAEEKEEETEEMEEV